MTRKPELLPEDTRPIVKTNTRSSTKPLLWLLILLLLVTMGGITTLIGIRPEVLGLMRFGDLDLTNTAFQGTALALNGTQTALQSTGQFYADRDIEFQSTQAALVNAANRINQTETQQVVNNSSTQTAVAASNAQQATQAAVNFINTQAALDATGTQVQIDYQSTREALNRILTATPPANSQSNIFVLNENFNSGVENSLRESLPTSGVWAIRGDGVLVAQKDIATLMLSPRDPNIYTLNVDLLMEKIGNYDILLNNGELLRVVYGGTQSNAVHIYTYQPDSLNTGLIVDTSRMMSSLTGMSKQLSVQVRVNAGIVDVIVNNLPLFNFSTTTTSAIGLQVPAGTQVQRFSID